VIAGSRAAWLALALLVAACGKAGPPLPPLRPALGRIADVTANRSDDRVEIRFTVPPANADGTTPSVMERVEIYGVSLAASAPAPTIAQMVAPKNLKTRINIRRPPKEKEGDASATPAPSPTPSPTPPAKPLDPLPGDPVIYRDPIAASEHGASAPVRYYAVVGVAGRDRKSLPAGLLAVPLAAEPAAPTDLAFTYDEHTLKLTWKAEEGAAFRVYAGKDTTGAIASGPTPLKTAEFSTPVTFGKEQCFIVRSLAVSGATTIEGAASAPGCTTAADTFPPGPPDDLRAIPEDAAVTLTWNAVDAADLGGYLVLRGEGAGDTLTPLMTTPIAMTTYKDTTVARGTTYTYAVVAVDTAQNRSTPSNKQTVTVR
jgi:hypothetical protein